MRRTAALLPHSRREPSLFAVLAPFAEIGEESAFSGHLTPYVQTRTGHSTLGAAVAVTLPAIPFSAAPLDQGAVDAAKTLALAVAFGAMLLLTGSLWIPIALHVLIDLAGGEIGLRVGFEPPGEAGALTGSSSPGGRP